VKQPYETKQYKKWFKNLRDRGVKHRIETRVYRLLEGNPGDHRFLGDICELKEHYGPGYRIYDYDTGAEIIILLCGGDKSDQQADIARARELLPQALKDLENQKKE
jgi:putative addiction module killer protein